jgi:AraC-like DNA-binding protein
MKKQTDKGLVRPIVEAIIREYQQRDLYNKELVQHLVNTLIVVVARNIARALPAQVNQQTDEKAVDILQYIQNNIYYPEKLKAGIIAGEFGISNSYLSRWFKTQTNETMQQYINCYRMKMIEHRLTHSNMRIGEIVAELGFTDESHLNKFFRKQKGLSPRQFRQSAAMHGANAVHQF